MRILGTGTFNANTTTMTNSLAAALLTRPEISTNLVNLFEGNFSAFSSFLARRGFMRKGLSADVSTSDFKVIGNRKFMWLLKGYPFRKGVITEAPTPTGGVANLGEGGTYFTLKLDTDYFSPNDTLELSDRRTILQVMDELPTESGSNVWEYKVKLVHSEDGAFVPTGLVAAGKEVGFSYTAFPEMSETAYEKNTFPEWHTNYMTIQRMKYSISGSANNTVLWIEHNGQKLWVAHQDIEMMRRWAYARENQLIFGRASIDANEKVHLSDMHGRKIIQGDGIIAQGDASLKYQYNNLTVKTLENVMQNLQLMATGDGTIEVFVMGGQAFVWSFQQLMRDVFKYNPQPLFTGGKGGSGVKVAFNSYEIGGVRLVVAWNKAFDAAWRPQEKDLHGTNKESYRAIFASLGDTIGGDPNIELVTLGAGSQDRRFVKRVITGMANPSMSGSGRMEYASNSMDGYQVHILSETGICLKNPFGLAELYRP